MRKETAQAVLPVFRHALLIKERLRHGEKCNMDAEQAELKGLLRQVESPSGVSGVGLPGATDAFLGIRYALACWLDEIFIVDNDSPWKSEWRDKTMELALFNMRERAHEFWKQAQLAESGGNLDALEVYYLCVMLGFRGDKREDFNGLLDWRDEVEGRITQDQAETWPDMPRALPEPESNASPLVWSDRLRLMMLTGVVVIGAAIAAAVVLVVWNN